MMTFAEAKLRCAANNCAMKRTSSGDYRVVHIGWRGDIEAKAYYTDDLEDAALTARAINDEFNSGRPRMRDA